MTSINTEFSEATEKQVAFINSLVSKRVVPADVLARLDDIEDGILSKAGASQLIDVLKGLPYRQGGAAAPRPAVQTVAPQPVQQVAEGLYTVHDAEGHVTFRVRSEAWADGKVVISYLTAVDGRQKYKGFGFVTPQGIKVWGSAQDKHRIIAAAQFLVTGSTDEARQNFLNLAEAHALSSGNCLACLRTLTVPASIHRGLGPDCAARLGLV